MNKKDNSTVQVNTTNSISYLIEEIGSKNGNYILRGIAFGSKTGEAADIIIEDTQSYTMGHELRPKQAKALGLDPNEAIGFTIEMEPKEGKIPRIILEDEEDNRTILPFAPNTLSRGAKIKSLLKNSTPLDLIGVLMGNKQVSWLPYNKWLKKDNAFDRKEIEQEIEEFKKKPLISIVMPVYNIKTVLLRKAIRSVQDQLYTNWELCIADDNSTDKKVRETLSSFAAKDPRIKLKFRSENGHIAEATNSAIALATGEYIAFMDDDDELSPIALYEYVKIINENKNVDLIYSDEDFIDMKDFHYNPFFKSNWNPRLFFSHNYITHFVMVKRSLLDKVGGLRSNTNGAQDYDFLIRLQNYAKDIIHVPKVLYHWRTVEGSVAENSAAKEYAYDAGQFALQDYFDKKEIPAEVSIGGNYGTYSIARKDKPPVSILIVNDPRDLSLSNRTLIETLNRTDYEDFEIIAVNFDQNLLSEEHPKDYQDERIKYFYNTKPMSEQELYKFAAEKAQNDLTAVVKAGIRPLKWDWLEKLVNETVFDETGLVTPVIYNNRNQIVSAGYAFDYPARTIYFPGKERDRGDLGYFFRTGLPQNVEANYSYCYLIPKEDLLEIETSDNFHEPLAGHDLSNQIYLRGKNVVVTPESTVVWMGDITDEVDRDDSDIILRSRLLPEEIIDFKSKYPEPVADFINDVIKRYRRSLDLRYQGLNKDRNV